jgi:hypothetical protein
MFSQAYTDTDTDTSYEEEDVSPTSTESPSSCVQVSDRVFTRVSSEMTADLLIKLGTEMAEADRLELNRQKKRAYLETLSLELGESKTDLSKYERVLSDLRTFDKMDLKIAHDRVIYLEHDVQTSKEQAEMTDRELDDRDATIKNLSEIEKKLREELKATVRLKSAIAKERDDLVHMMCSERGTRRYLVGVIGILVACFFTIV